MTFYRSLATITVAAHVIACSAEDSEIADRQRANVPDAAVSMTHDGGTTHSTGAHDASTPAEAEASIVVDVGWLAARLDDDGVQIVDARTDFVGGHIPGAIPLDPLRLIDPVAAVAAQVAPADVAQEVLRGVGLRNGTTAVVYGAPPEYDPARVVWALSYYGHDARYLDGGFTAWQAAGEPTSEGQPQPDGPSDYDLAGVDDSIRVTGDWVLEKLGPEPYDSVAIQLVDARSPEEWSAGHIPGAVHVRWSLNLDAGLYLPEDENAALYEGLDPSQTTVAYCLVGWRASVAWLTLRKLGFEDVRVYDGSWQEWGADSRFPVVVP